MIQFLETSAGRILLIIVVILIWGVNMVNFTKMAQQEDNLVSNTSIELIEVELPQKSSYVYKERDRDPFQPRSIRQIPQPLIDKTETFEVIKMPTIELIGIMGATGILRIDNKQTVIREAGEVVINNIVLEKVYSDSVKLKHKNNNIILKLNN